MRMPWLALFLAASTAAFGGDEFDHVVSAVESHYGTTRTHIPFLGLASLFVRVARPAGASGFKLAVFQDLKTNPRDQAGLDQFMYSLSSTDLHPLVRVHSRRHGESTYIYSGEIGRSTRMLIATFQPNQATVVEVKVNLETLLKWIDEPDRAGKSLDPSDDR